MSTQFENQTSINDTETMYGALWVAQVFTATSNHTVTSVKMNISNPLGVGSGTVVCGVQDTSGGAPIGSGTDLTSGTIDCSAIGATPTVVTFTMSSYSLVNTTKYAIVLRWPAGVFATRLVANDDVPCDYSGGNEWFSSNSGGTWSDGGSTRSLYFEVWGDASTTTSTSSSSSSTSSSSSSVSTSSSSSSVSTSSSSSSVTLPGSGGLAFGEQFPITETAVSWQTWDNGAGVVVQVTGDPDWGKMDLYPGGKGQSRVYDFGNATARVLTVTKNKYGTGDSIPVWIRGQATIFYQDDALPAWELYTIPVSKTWQFIQVKAEVP